MDERIRAEVIVIGAGIAGASIACWLAPRARVVIIEGESMPGYHATGRSAAMFIETYGGEQVRALTRASRPFFEHPPGGFAGAPLLTPRGALVVATPEQRDQLDRHWQLLQSLSADSRRLNRDEVTRMLPVLRAERLLGATYEPDACDLDVHALLHGYLRVARRAGASLAWGTVVSAIERSGHEWLVQAGEQVYQAPIVINAAGAWADAIARLAGVPLIGIEPRRRSAFTFAPPAGLDTRGWPLLIGADEDWYLKPDAGMLLGSPANADPVEPQDVQPEELDIALGVDRIERMTTLTIRRPRHKWAGLRSFVADGGLVGGFAASAPGFFWLAGQGGYGIQTSAAMGEGCAALALGLPLPSAIADCGLSAAMLSPLRLQPIDPPAEADASSA